MTKSVRDETIPESMNAVRCHSIRDYRLEKLPSPQPEDLKENEILVRVTGCGICASDVKCYTGAPMFWGDKHRKGYVQAPVTAGHEFCGEVVTSRREGFEPGDSVTAEQVMPCHSCMYCRRGLRWLCAPHDIFGFHQVSQGAMAEYMIFPANAVVHQVPKRIPASEAVFIEPLSCSVHAVTRAAPTLGDTIVVSGCGPIGLGIVAAARATGPGRLVAVDPHAHRRELARKCGADVVIDPITDHVGKIVREMTDGYGCDVYIEASGNPNSVMQGLDACRKAATFVEYAVFGKETSVDWTIIGDTKELDVRGGHCSGENGYKVAIDMLDKGCLPIENIITHSLPLGQYLDGISLVGDGSESIKVTLDPTLSS